MQYPDEVAQIISESEAIKLKLDTAKKAHRKLVIKQIQALMVEFAISETQLVSKKSGKPRKAIAPRPAKYKDPVSGSTWTGQGRAPRWFSESKRAELLIA